MADPKRNWTITINNTQKYSTSTQLLQDWFYRLKEMLKAAGWTVTISSNGTIAGAGDNIASSSQVAIETSGNGAWIVLSSPAGFADDTNTTWMLLAINESSSPFQTVYLRYSTAEYTGGSTSSLPITVGTELTQFENAAHSLPEATFPTTMNFYQGYTDEGDVVFFYKPVGQAAVLGLFLLHHFKDENGGYGDFRFCYYFHSSSSNILTNVSNLRQTFWCAFDANGDTVATSLSPVNYAWWVSAGLPVFSSDNYGKIWIEPVSIMDAERYFGQMDDIYVGITRGPQGAILKPDIGQTYVRMFFEGYWFYVPYASLPMV